jgi:hypothetical protein
MRMPLALRQQRLDAQRNGAGLHAKFLEAEATGRVGQRMELAMQLVPVGVVRAVGLAQRERRIHFLEAHMQASGEYLRQYFYPGLDCVFVAHADPKMKNAAQSTLNGIFSTSAGAYLTSRPFTGTRSASRREPAAAFRRRPFMMVS